MRLIDPLVFHQPATRTSPQTPFPTPDKRAVQRDVNLDKIIARAARLSRPQKVRLMNQGKQSRGARESAGGGGGRISRCRNTLHLRRATSPSGHATVPV